MKQIITGMVTKTFCSCEKCGELAEVDTSLVLTSNPPCYKYKCDNCGHVGYTQDLSYCAPDNHDDMRDVCEYNKMLFDIKENGNKAKAFEVVKEELGIDVALRYPDNQPMLAVFVDGFEVVRKPISKEKYDLLNEAEE